MSSQVHSLLDVGSDGIVVDIECGLSNNLPIIVIVGFGNRAIDESKERVRGAFASSRIELPRKRITINLAPADVPKDSSSFDLAIAAAIMQAGSSLPVRFQPHEAVMGELGLDGSVRPVRGIIGKLLAGKKHGFTTFYLPAANAAQARLVPDITLIPLTTLKELHMHLNGTPTVTPFHTTNGIADGSAHVPPETTSITDVIGQQMAKRALEIAAAGGHNILLNGPPGTGKSMLARALPSLLPVLTPDEILEVTHLHSLAGKSCDQVIYARPFRAPHHSASNVSILGGGATLRPGEISLSHRGVLFFDEFPEFNRSTIEALRQPLEDRAITISRARDSREYPADFILVATSNPCPCGYYGTGRECTCTAGSLQRYRARMSGPILDRIDLYTDVQEVDHAKLLDIPSPETTDEAVRQRIVRARAVQRGRFASPLLNAGMSNSDLKTYARLSAPARELLDTAGKRLDLSARAYMRTAKVARTIADLAGCDETDVPHISEALQFRARGAPTA